MVDSRPNIWGMQSRQDMQGLIKALRYPDPEIRGRAAVALRTLEATQAVPALQMALEDELDEQARKYMREALRLIGQGTNVAQLVEEQDLDGLLEALNSTQSDTVIFASRALGLLGDRLAVEPLVMVFQNPTSPPDVRLAAAEALLELQSAPAVVTLLGALRRDSWQVRRNAAAVLGQIQAIWAVKPLAEALSDSHPVVRRSAAAALKRIGTAEAMIALRAQFTTTSEAPAVAAKSAQAPLEERGAETSSDQFHFESTPPVISSKEKERASSPSLMRAAKPESVEAGEEYTPRTIRPTTVRQEISAADTNPGRPILKPPPQRIKTVRKTPTMTPVVSKSTSVTPSESDEVANRQNPITRMIAFMRRRGERNS